MAFPVTKDTAIIDLNINVVSVRPEERLYANGLQPMAGDTIHFKNRYSGLVHVWIITDVLDLEYGTVLFSGSAVNFCPQQCHLIKRNGLPIPEKEQGQ